MILKGSQRGGGRQLAAHLLRADENEHVQVHELRGFSAEHLRGAFDEAYAVSRATQAKQYLFSLSLNPPRDARVSTAQFESAVDKVEQSLGLTGQPRAIVFHEKDGRRHAHAVWSRIDAEQMKAVHLPFYKTRLREVARELYLEHGWQMPRGFVNSKERDPANFSLEEWQQAKRAGHDPKALKQMFQECWAISDSGKAFASALHSRGYTLAQGDRRGYVAVDYHGEVYGIARSVGVRTAQVKARLGDPEKLPSVADANRDIAARMTEMLKKHAQHMESQIKAQSINLTLRRNEIVQRQRTEREEMDAAHEVRRQREAQERAARLRGGLLGLWDRLTGKRAEVLRLNEREALTSLTRDRAEKDGLISNHIDKRRSLHHDIRQVRQRQTEQLRDLHRDIADYITMGEQAQRQSLEHSRSETPPARDHPARSRQPRQRSRDDGWEQER